MCQSMPSPTASSLSTSPRQFRTLAFNKPRRGSTVSTFSSDGESSSIRSTTSLSSSVASAASTGGVGAWRTTPMSGSTASYNTATGRSTTPNTAPSISGGSSSSSSSPSLLPLFLVQRSNATFVKSNVTLIAQKCIAYENGACGDNSMSDNGNDSTATLVPPIPEIRSIRSCADDPYYQVVLAKCGSIPIILTAMKTFMNHANNNSNNTETDDIIVEFLEICALTLLKLCQGNHQNYQSVLKGHGQSIIRRAYEEHPTSYELRQVTDYFSM